MVCLDEVTGMRLFHPRAWMSLEHTEDLAVVCRARWSSNTGVQTELQCIGTTRPWSLFQHMN